MPRIIWGEVGGDEPGDAAWLRLWVSVTSLQGLFQLINCTVTCCTGHHQATYGEG